MSTLRTYLGSKLVALGANVEQPYQRPANYPSITEPTASEDKCVFLARLFKPFGTGNSARNSISLRLRSGSSNNFTVTGSDGTSVTVTHNVNTELVFDYDNATSYAIDVNSAASGTDYYIEDLGNTSQADWNTLAGTSGVTYAVGSFFQAAVAGSTLTDSTGTVSIYNFRHVVITITGTNWTEASRQNPNSNLAIEEVYLSMPNYTGTSISGIGLFTAHIPEDYFKYYKIVSTFSSITNATSFLSGSTGLIEFNCPSNFLPNATNLTSFFLSCRSLTKTSVFDTSSVTNFQNFFSNCYSYPVIPNFNFSSATNLTSAFTLMLKLKVVGNLSFPNATTCTSMFNSCRGLEEVGDISMPSATTMTSIFRNCTSLKKIGAITATSCTNFNSAFYSCFTLKSIDSFSFVSSGSINFFETYKNCHALEVAFVPDSSVSYSNIRQAFQGTTSLTTIEPKSVTMNASSITSTNGSSNLFSTSGIIRLPNITFNTSTFSGSALDLLNGATRVAEIPAYDFSTVSGSLSNNRLFRTMPPTVKRIQATGIACTFDAADASLSADALDELMTNCATVSGKTMDISNNPGTDDCDTTIATNKGWTVTT